MVTSKEIDNFDVNSNIENSLYGYMLEVDLEYIDELRDFYNGYSLAPEKIEISNDMLSQYCSDIAIKYGKKVGGVNKLVPNLGNKSSIHKSSVIFITWNEIS